MIAKLSEMVELAAGDIIMTGTPSGVAATVAGDKLECEIAGVGTLTITMGPPASSPLSGTGSEGYIRRMDQSQAPVSSPKALQPSDGTAASWRSALLRPIEGFRLSYLPLVMVYFAYGALGIIDVTRDMWIKEQLTLTPAELAGLACG